MKPRPFFFAHVMGIRAYMLGRSILMKAVGMWHWEVRHSLLVIHTLRRKYRIIYVKSSRSSLHMPWASEHTCRAALSSTRL